MANRTQQSSEAYRRLRRLLIHEQIRPGLRLAETAWASELGVNRTALREAMSLLAHEGLLRRGEKGGFFTPLLEQRDLDEVWEVRAFMEVGALRVICMRRPSRKEHALLTHACGQMQRMADEGFELGLCEADRAFHLAIIRLSQNQRLINLYEHAPLPLSASREPDPAKRRAATEQTIREHRQLVQLIHQRKAAEAVELLEKHLHRAHRLAPIF